jgi:hypothetical protein
LKTLRGREVSANFTVGASESSPMYVFHFGGLLDLTEGLDEYIGVSWVLLARAHVMKSTVDPNEKYTIEISYTTGTESSTTDEAKTDIENGFSVAVGYKREAGGAYAEVKYDFKHTQSVSRAVTDMVSTSETIKIAKESPRAFGLWAFVMTVRGHKLNTPEYVFTEEKENEKLMDPNKDTSFLEMLELKYIGNKK